MTITEKTWNDLSEYRDSLEHYGVKGMKWGVRKDRKTSGTKSKTKTKKKTLSETLKAKRAQRAKKRVERAKARAEKKAAEEKLKAEKKAAEEKAKAEKAAAKKEKQRRAILDNPTKLYKHRKEFSQQEIQQAMQQFDWERRLNSYSRDQLNNGAEFIKTMFNYANNSINLYNTAARVANSFNEDLNMPYIKQIKDKDKKNNN